MSRTCRVLALVTLAAIPASAHAGGNTLGPAHGTHNGAAKAGTATPKAGSAPASVALPHGQGVLGAGKTGAKPAAPLPRPHPQGVANSPAASGLNAAPNGLASSPAGAGHAIGSGMATNPAAARVQTTTKPGSPGVSPAVASGVGVRKTAGELNGTTISPRGMARGNINPGANMVGSINGTTLGRKH